MTPEDKKIFIEALQLLEAVKKKLLTLYLKYDRQSVETSP